MGEISGSYKETALSKTLYFGSVPVCERGNKRVRRGLMWPFYRMDLKLLADLRGPLRASRGANEKSHSSPVCLHADVCLCAVDYGFKGKQTV